MTKKRKKGRLPGLTWLLAGAAGAGIAFRMVKVQQQRMDFAGKVSVISGGSRGLGLVLARKLAEQGAQLALLARTLEDLQEAERELESYETSVITIPCDVSDQRQVEQALDQVVRRFGTIDVLINNAGIVQVGPLEEMTNEDFQEAMSVHFWGPFFTSRAAAAYMRQRGGGRIVNIASIGGKVAVPHMALYIASKFALEGYSDAMRAELARDHILVTTVTPGLMRTGSHLNAWFKGRRKQEFTWFSVLDGLPFTSINVEKAADQILEACRYGKSQLVITPQARLLIIANALFPGAVAEGMKLFNRFLPSPVGDQNRYTGWESRSLASPSALTSLADKAAEENNELRGHKPVR